MENYPESHPTPLNQHQAALLGRREIFQVALFPL